MGELARMLSEKGVVGSEKDGRTLGLYSFVGLGLEGVSVLNGTSDSGHMRGDIEGLELVRGLIHGEWEAEWKDLVGEFKRLVGEVD